jgi:hypothetical protein
MRTVFFAMCSVILLASCTGNGGTKQETLPEEMKSQALDLSGYSKRNIVLINQLGRVSIYLPVAMDTFFTYADFGEYHCGETKQFRFASKKFNPVGIIDLSYSDPTDSVYQGTIIQTYNKDCETNTTIDEQLLKSLQKDKTHMYTMIDVRGKKVIVGVMELSLKETDVAEVTAITSVSGRMIKFLFQCHKKMAGNFTSQILTSLKTLEIGENAVRG